MGLGTVPLWPLALRAALWMGLDAGLYLGSELGDLAQFGSVLRVGTIAASLRRASWFWIQLLGKQCGVQL